MTTEQNVKSDKDLRYAHAHIELTAWQQVREGLNSLVMLFNAGYVGVGSGGEESFQRLFAATLELDRGNRDFRDIVANRVGHLGAHLAYQDQLARRAEFLRDHPEERTEHEIA